MLGIEQAIERVETRQSLFIVAGKDVDDLHAQRVVRLPCRHQQQRRVRLGVELYTMMMAGRRHASADEHFTQRRYQRGEGQRTLGLAGINNSHLRFLTQKILTAQPDWRDGRASKYDATDQAVARQVSPRASSRWKLEEVSCYHRLMSRTGRKNVAWLCLSALLFLQLAVAAYACPSADGSRQFDIGGCRCRRLAVSGNGSGAPETLRATLCPGFTVGRYPTAFSGKRAALAASGSRCSVGCSFRHRAQGPWRII